jgi:hypothetical protein
MSVDRGKVLIAKWLCLGRLQSGGFHSLHFSVGCQARRFDRRHPTEIGGEHKAALTSPSLQAYTVQARYVG